VSPPREARSRYIGGHLLQRCQAHARSKSPRKDTDAALLHFDGRVDGRLQRRFLGHDIACPIGYESHRLLGRRRPLSKKRGATKRTEHFLRWFHHFRWIILHRYGVVHSVSDPEMLADILTKCVNPAKFHLCAKGLRGA